MGLAHTSRLVHGEPPLAPPGAAPSGLSPAPSQPISGPKVFVKGPASGASNVPIGKLHPGKAKVVHPTHLIANMQGLEGENAGSDSNDGEGSMGAPLAGASDEGRHVSGQQLCMGLRDFALRQYGLLAGNVLRSWGLRETSDFGNIVFGMIEVGLFRKTDEDSREDFERVYLFDDAFPDVLGKALDDDALSRKA